MARGLLPRSTPVERAAIAGAKARLDRLDLYPRPVDIRRVRVLHTPWLFALPWFRRFDGYEAGPLIFLRQPLAETLRLPSDGRVHLGDMNPADAVDVDAMVEPFLFKPDIQTGGDGNPILILDPVQPGG